MQYGPTPQHTPAPCPHFWFCGFIVSKAFVLKQDRTSPFGLCRALDHDRRPEGHEEGDGRKTSSILPGISLGRGPQGAGQARVPEESP